jgi:hypothetical protein
MEERQHRNAYLTRIRGREKVTCLENNEIGRDSHIRFGEARVGSHRNFRLDNLKATLGASLSSS